MSNNNQGTPWNSAFWADGNPTVVCSLLLNKECVDYIFELCKKHKFGDEDADHVVERTNQALSFYRAFRENLDQKPNRKDRLSVHANIVRTAQDLIDALGDIDSATYNHVSLHMQEKLLEKKFNNEVQTLNDIVRQTESYVEGLYDIFIQAGTSIKASPQRDSPITEARTILVNTLGSILADVGLPISGTTIGKDSRKGKSNEGGFHKLVRLSLASIDPTYVSEMREIGEVKTVKKQLGI